MKKQIGILTFLFSGIILSSCGTGTSNGQSTNYYTPSPNYYYQVSIESATTESGLQTAILNQVNNTGNVFLSLTLTQSPSNPSLYTYNSSDGTIQATLTLKNGTLGFAVQNTQNTNQQFSDFATSNITNNIPDGSYIAMCNVNNYNPCLITISSNNLTAVQLINNNGSLSQTTICNNIPINPVNSLNTPDLYSLSCNSSSGNQFYLLPFTANGQIGFLINENVGGYVSGLDDGTDDIAFPQESGLLSPSGTYNYLYSAYASLGQIPQNGLGSATFNGTQVNNMVMGMGIPGQSIIMTQNSVFLSNVGFTPNLPINTLTLNGGQQVYNLVGSDLMQIYQDNFEGIYY